MSSKDASVDMLHPFIKCWVCLQVPIQVGNPRRAVQVGEYIGVERRWGWRAQEPLVPPETLRKRLHRDAELVNHVLDVYPRA